MHPVRERAAATMQVEGVERMFSLSGRTRSMLCAALLCAVAPLLSQAGAAVEKARFRIAAGAAAESLAQFSRQAGLQLLFDYEAVQGVHTRAVHGAFEAEEALERMLGGTNLTFAFVNDRTVSIVPRTQDGGPAQDKPGAYAGVQDPGSLPSEVEAGRDREPRLPGRHAGIPGEAALLQEIIVSAEKRDSALQRTALAVSALSFESAERQQVTDLKSLATLIPNLQIGATSDQAAVDVALRGIVSTNRTEVGDAAVAFHVDGFYSPRPQGATTLIYDIERLEVLRGPQGTLFGRNANAGVINVVTAKPRFGEQSAMIDVTSGDYDLFRLKGHVNMPVSDTLAVRAAGYVEKRDGFIDFQPGSSVLPGTAKYDDSDKVATRLSMIWEPRDDLSVFLSGERYADTGAGTVPVSIVPAPGMQLRSALVSSPGVLDLANETLHLRTDFRPLESLELSYLFGWAKMTRMNVNDNDVGLATHPFVQSQLNPPLHATFDEEHRTHDSKFVSRQHEIQLKSLSEGPLEWIAGAFYYEEDNSIRFDIDFMDDGGSVAGLPDAGDLRFAQTFLQPDRELSAWAGFVQSTYNFTDALRATAGLRYTQDSKQDTNGINVICPDDNVTIGEGGITLRGVATEDIPWVPGRKSEVSVPGKCRVIESNDVYKDWSKITYMARAEYDFGKDLLGYALVSTGFKSGVIQDSGSYADPEEVLNYEVGWKTTLLGGAMTLNNVGFFSDYSDILRARMEIANGKQQLVNRNATEARIFGVESELTWRVGPADRVQGVFTWLNAEYEDFLTIDTTLYLPDDQQSPFTNLEGNKLPFAPEFTAAFVYEHEFALANGARIIPRLQTKYQSEMFLSDFNRTTDRQPAYTRSDLGIRYESPAAWLFEVFVQNIEDDAVMNNVDIRGFEPGVGGIAGFPGVPHAFLDPPRIYGVRASYRFSN